jgi:hypothetical protein
LKVALQLAVANVRALAIHAANPTPGSVAAVPPPAPPAEVRLVFPGD